MKFVGPFTSGIAGCHYTFLFSLNHLEKIVVSQIFDWFVLEIFDWKARMTFVDVLLPFLRRGDADLCPFVIRL